MTKQRIRWIAALMTVGLLGLITLQLYWISNALSLQKSQFDYKVTDAMQEVVRTLERQEIIYMTRQRLNQQEQNQRLMAIGRSGGKPVSPRPRLMTKSKRLPEWMANRPLNKNLDSGRLAFRSFNKHQQSLPEGLATASVPARTWPHAVSPSDVLHPDLQRLSDLQQQHMEEFLRQQDALEPYEVWSLHLQQQRHFNQVVDEIFQGQMQLVMGQPLPDSMSIAYVLPRQRKLTRRSRAAQSPAPQPASPAKVQSSPTTNLQKAERQSEMVKDVVKDLLFANRPLRSRISREFLDSLLKQAMQERGITTPFAYGVRTNVGSKLVKPQLLFASHSIHEDYSDKRLYKAALFPNNLFENGNELYVYFPNQEPYILRKMGATLAGSAVMVLVIMACFYVAISTIVQQKKLADIKNDFINNMTHEFKTPISTISLAVEMAQEQLGTDSNSGDNAVPRLSRYMGIIRDETRRLGTHVEKVLQMALLDRGSVKLKLSPVNIHDAIGKALNTIGLQIEQKHGEVHLEFDAENEIVEADEVHLSNILYNLLDNAIKYSPDRPDITIRTRSLEKGVSITIADHGIGMTKEQQNRIFEKFYRVPTGNLHDVKGFGLGLSYVKKMVEEHHGTIQVASQPGRGSSFEIVVPYHQT